MAVMVMEGAPCETNEPDNFGRQMSSDDQVAVMFRHEGPALYFRYIVGLVFLCYE